MNVLPTPVEANQGISAVQLVVQEPTEGIKKSETTSKIMQGMKEISSYIAESSTATQMALMAKDQSVTKLDTESVEYALLQKNKGLFATVQDSSRLRFAPDKIDSDDKKLAESHLDEHKFPVSSMKELGHLSSSDEDSDDDQLTSQGKQDRNISRRELRQFAETTVHNDMKAWMPVSDSAPNPLSCGDVRAMVTSLALDTDDYSFDVSKYHTKISSNGDLQTLQMHLDTKLTQDEGVILSMYDKVAGHDTVFYFPPLSEQIDPQKPSAFLFQADMGDGFTNELTFNNWMDSRGDEPVAYDDLFGYMNDTINANVDFDRAARIFDVKGEDSSRTLQDGYQEKYSQGQQDQEFKVHLHNVDPSNFLQNVQEFDQTAFKMTMK